MNWMNQIVNEYPAGLIFVYIQNNKAVDFSGRSGFFNTEKVLAFSTKDQADYFIANYDPEAMNYKDSCLRGDYVFYVFNKCPGGYYADDIRLYSLRK